MNHRNITRLATILALAGAGIAPALAVDSEQLAKDKMCFNCHEIKGEKRGPSFQDISRRFSGLSNARRMLVREVQAGTNGPGALHHWGNLKMPADSSRVEVSQAEAEQLVDYILGIK